MQKNIRPQSTKQPNVDFHERKTARGNPVFVDLFAGCGGLSLGLENAGFQPILFSEINHSAAETYIANRSELDIIPVGDVYNLTNTDLNLLKVYWSYKGIHDIDLVCGGPPCQGYSGIGHRRTFKLEKKEIPSNHLYGEMARVIKALRPKAFLFENVRGLLFSKWSAEGEKGEIFRDVLKTFQSLTEYHVKWDLLFAKDYGVPQNRPRVMIVGYRSDVCQTELPLGLVREEMLFSDPNAVRDGFLPKPEGSPPSMPDLLSDLEDLDFHNKKATLAYPREPHNETQKRLRTSRDGKVLHLGDPLTDHEYSSHSPAVIDKFKHMILHGGEIPKKYQTKKFAQRVLPVKWGPDGPSITATSLPDDYVHYALPRAPTVREWARIQMFPDWYVFKGPRTTGGRRRAGDPEKGLWGRDVPKYTQIGNAVPVLLAEKVGRHIRGMINESR